MPILSYVVYPVRGQRERLIQQLQETSFCQSVPAVNKDVVLLVTDTPNPLEEERLQKKLKKMEEIQCLALAFGHTDCEEGGEAK